MAKLNSNGTVTVETGDCLWNIAKQYTSSALNWTEIAALNGIDPNNPTIYTGNTLKMPGSTSSGGSSSGGSGGSSSSGSSTPTYSTTNLSSQVTIEFFSLLAGSQREMFVAWSWNQSNTENYEVKWVYGTGQGFEVIGTKTTTDEKQSTYSAPENAEYVGVYIKPISKKRSNSESYYWTANWSTVKTYYFSNNPPDVPPVPTVEIDKYTIKASVENLDLNAKQIQFQIVKDDETVFHTGNATIKTTRASYSCTVNAGSEYKVRCRGVRDTIYGEWSEYSANVGTAPAASSGITDLRALSETSVYIEWQPANNAKRYELSYTTDQTYFDSSNQAQGMTVESIVNHAEITGLESGKEWFFRVRSVNDQGESAWTAIKSVKIGTVPSSPTTWSSTTKVSVGDPLVLYWIHNSEDGSDQRQTELELTTGTNTITHFIIYSATCPTLEGTAAKTIPFSGFVLNANVILKVKMQYANTAANPTLNVNNTGAIPIKASEPDDIFWRAGDVIIFKYDTKDWVILDADAQQNMNSFPVDTSVYTEGTKILWRARTKGILASYGDWSVQRTVDVYAPPTLMMSITDLDGEVIDSLTTLPFYVVGIPGPDTQSPIGYFVSVTANSAYETVDNIGNFKMVKAGDEIYSNYFDISSELLLEFSAHNISLENNINYTVTVTVSMDSGLTAEASANFTVAWDGGTCWPNLEIEYDPETYTTHLRPHCEDIYGDPIEGYILAVYRREFDGTFTELATGLVNVEQTFITDPHPALDYARYRVVATETTTGRVTYYDVPGFPIGETSAIIQWDEVWSYLADSVEIPYEQPAWSGSLLKLPYNIDVAPKYDPDVILAEYIGRKHPVSYYGTQLGETATWNAEIDKEDTETLYALRRLAIWMGDVYVREPSGSGYWANINVTFPQKHLDLTIPVTLDIARVEGGV